MLDTIERDGYSDLLRSRDGIALLPYCELDGTRTVPDRMLSQLWELLAEHQVRDTVFPGIEDASEFIAFLKRDSNLPTLMFSGEYAPDDLLGLAWLNNIAENYGFGHFAFLPRAWGGPADMAGRQVLRYWFGAFVDLAVIIGNIPAWNRHAIKYIHRLGFQHVGEIPKIARDESMSINYLEREQWENQAAAAAH